MSLAIAFWILLLLRLVLGVWRNYSPSQPYPAAIWGVSLLDWLILLILGWKVFGAPIQ